MDRTCNTVALFADSLQLQRALQTLHQAGFQLGQLSVIGKNQHHEINVTGVVDSGSGNRYWGRFGGLAGSLWRPRGGSALLLFPGIGQVVIFGPLVNTLGSALAAAGSAALGSALAAYGLPQDCALRYDNAIREGRLAVVAHGNAVETGAARLLLETAGAIEVQQHFTGRLF